VRDAYLSSFGVGLTYPLRVLLARRSISNPGLVVSSSSNIASFRVLSKSYTRYNSSGTSSRAVDSTLEKKLKIWELMVVLVGRER